MKIQAKVENIREKFKSRLDYRADERGGKNALIYGLCEGVGIDTTGMKPREAWDAYKEKTGNSMDIVFIEKNMPKMEIVELYQALEQVTKQLYKEMDDKTRDAFTKTYQKLRDSIKKRENEEWAKEQKKKKEKAKETEPNEESETKKETEPKKNARKKEESAKKPTDEKPSEKPKEVAKEENKGTDTGNGSTGDYQKGENGSTEKTSKEPSGAKVFDQSAYSKDRKEKALWSKSPEEVDSKVRGVCEEVWQNANWDEKKSAILYTKFAMGMFNNPQREAGMRGDFSAQSKSVENLTNLIDRSSYDFDMNLQRGMTLSGASKFLGISEDKLKKLNEKDLNNELKGTTPIEYGFTSTGGAEGYGATPQDDKKYEVQFKIYAPAGTKMLYCEPFSWYNKQNGNPPDWDFYHYWDGKKKYKGGYSREFEMLLQRNSRYRVTGVRNVKGVLWVDMEVIGQGDE